MMMDYQFSDRVLALKPSIIREILKNSSDPSVIPFSAGNPAPEAFPAKEIAEISQTILSETPIAALQYSITEGYTPLRETISSYMKSHHQIGREFDDIIVTSGAQQVMNLASKVLCNEEDVIICEAPSFIGSLNTFRSIKTRYFDGRRRHEHVGVGASFKRRTKRTYDLYHSKLSKSVRNYNEL